MKDHTPVQQIGLHTEGFGQVVESEDYLVLWNRTGGRVLIRCDVRHPGQPVAPKPTQYLLCHVPSGLYLGSGRPLDFVTKLETARRFATVADAVTAGIDLVQQAPDLRQWEVVSLNAKGQRSAAGIFGTLAQLAGCED